MSIQRTIHRKVLLLHVLIAEEIGKIQISSVFYTIFNGWFDLVLLLHNSFRYVVTIFGPHCHTYICCIFGEPEPLIIHQHICLFVLVLDIHTLHTISWKESRGWPDKSENKVQGKWKRLSPLDIFITKKSQFASHPKQTAKKCCSVLRGPCLTGTSPSSDAFPVWMFPRVTG